MRCEPLDLAYIDGMLLLPLIIEHTIGALRLLGALRGGGRMLVPEGSSWCSRGKGLRAAQQQFLAPARPPGADERSPLCGHTYDSLAVRGRGCGCCLGRQLRQRLGPLLDLW